MTGFGSPCGACKFLRRKCANGCIFAPYFSHEQGPTIFAAIHKVFGASNVSKLLSHLPVRERSEAAVTISYEAQARLHDPVYGCVSHIFALQQQVFNLQAQLISLKAQATQTLPISGSSSSSSQEDNFHGKLLPSIYDSSNDIQSLFHLQENPKMTNQFQRIQTNNPSETMIYYGNEIMDNSPNPISDQNYHSAMLGANSSFTTIEDSSSPPFISSTTSSDFMQTDIRKMAYQSIDNFQSITGSFAYLN